MATKGRPPSPERRYLDPAFQRKLWRNIEGRKLSLRGVRLLWRNIEPRKLSLNEWRNLLWNIEVRKKEHKLWRSKDGGPYRYRMPLGRPPGLTLPNGLKCDMVHVIGMAEYYFYEAKERGQRITKRAAFEKGIEEILADNGLHLSSAKRLADTAMRIHRTMVHDLGLLPIS